MEYPLNRQTTPMEVEVARKLSQAVENDESVANEKARATFQRILARREQKANDATTANNTSEVL